MKRKLENLKVTSFVTNLHSSVSRTIAGGRSLGCQLEAEPMPKSAFCISVDGYRCASVDGYTCPEPTPPKPEGPLPKV